MTDLAIADLIEQVRREAAGDGRVESRASRVAELIRIGTGRRWVGIYRVSSAEVTNIAWSGPAAPAFPTFPIAQGLTGAAILTRASVLSNDVANDARYARRRPTLTRSSPRPSSMNDIPGDECSRLRKE